MPITFENNMNAKVTYDVTDVLPNIDPKDSEEFQRYMKSWETMTIVLADQGTEMGEWLAEQDESELNQPYESDITYSLWKVEFNTAPEEVQWYGWFFQSTCGKNPPSNHLDKYTHLGEYNAHVTATVTYDKE